MNNLQPSQDEIFIEHKQDIERRIAEAAEELSELMEDEKFSIWEAEEILLQNGLELDYMFEVLNHIH